MTRLSETLRKKLVQSLCEKGVIQSPAVEQAFLTVPREAFVSSFFEQSSGSSLLWTQYDATQMSEADYLEQIYLDQALVTQLNERKMPSSSSSLPSVMAKMLEALDVRPGQRILEVGTGTGYNAALLAVLTADPTAVVTIDMDPSLTENAAQVLHEVVGSGIRVVTGDGFYGAAAWAPYDRIIVTASIPTIPCSLVDQLAVGGKLVMDLQGPLASGFLVLEKTYDGVIGHFLPEPLYFMPLVSEALSVPEPVSVKSVPQSGTFLLPESHPYPGILSNTDFRWFFQWYLPGSRVQSLKRRDQKTDQMMSQISVSDAQLAAIVRFLKHPDQMFWSVEIYGTSPLFLRLLDAYDAFLSLGEAAPSYYQVQIENGEKALCIDGLKLLF
ncbi:rRNA adenine N-6-methyltransferase family protein [Tengunoibacter tsumagoiensis]|nr:rRNA adenine N-6-methyltransferase family protein [Tengunoibacter tsumagoiensis]